MTEKFNLKPGEDYNFVIENKKNGATFKKDDVVYYDLDFNQYVIKTDDGLVVYNDNEVLEMCNLKFIFEDDMVAFFNEGYAIYVYNKETKRMYEFLDMMFQYEKYLND